MSSGKRTEIINSQERAVSNDINRLQSFQDNDFAEVLRGLLSTQSASDFSANLEVEVSGTIGTPIEGHIIKGLMVRPQSGTDDLQVSAGVVMLQDRDGLTGSSDPATANPDENDFKFVNSDGVPASGTLSIAANPDPSIRIDVIECRRIPTNVQESENRDIIDSSGNFFPQLVNKVAKSELEFRVRVGTAGAGFPGTVQGWLPLAVASIPGSTVAPTVDSTTFWDVRPMIRDRWRSPFNESNIYSDLWMPTAISNDANNAVLTGECWGVVGGVTAFGGGSPQRAGGLWRSGVPGTGDDLSLALRATENQDGGSFASTNVFYVWALFPFGLPTWTRYNETGGRLPGPFRGIPVVSATGPAGASSSVPVSAVSLPASTGLSGSTNSGVCLYSGPVVASDPTPSSCTAGLVKFEGTIIQLGPATTTSGTRAFWDLTSGTDFPPNAISLVMRFSWRLTGATASSIFGVNITTGTTNDLTGTVLSYSGTPQFTFMQVHSNGSGEIPDATGLSNIAIIEAEVPVKPDFPAGAHENPSTPGLPDQRVGVSITGTDASGFGSTSALIVGWRLAGR